MPLDPQVQQFLAAQAEANKDVPPISEQPPEMARAGYRVLGEMLGQGPAVASLAEIEIPGPSGVIPARVYRPVSEPGLGVLVYYHGGGWTIGDLDTHDHVCRDLATGGGCVVVSVDYRLAPEHPFPAAVDDAYAALAWLGHHAAEIGGDPGRIVVGGDSAGGNLAAVVSLLARDGGGPKLLQQLLIYPAVDMRMDHPSIKENGEGYVLTEEHMLWFRANYAPDPATHEDPRMSPLLAESHADLPPALVITAEFDPLRDEGAAYVEALRAAGVPARLSCYDGMVHVFFQLSPILEGGKRAVAEAAAALQQVFTATQSLRV